MNNRSFADLMVGVLAYVSLSGLAAVAADPAAVPKPPEPRWSLPVKRRPSHIREDACRHCNGSGHCEACSPATCRVCRGTGLQPHDAMVLSRLTKLWNGAS